MKKIDVVQPYAMASVFAEDVYSASSTQDFEIPAATSTSADDTCVLDDGFLPITSTDLDDGGIAPERKNFNGLFYLSTDQRAYLQNGGIITYNSNVATAIGGYPQDAVLAYKTTNGFVRYVKSLIDDNSNNFVTNPSLIDGVHWDWANDYLNHDQISNCILEIPQDIKLELNNGALTLKAGSKVYVPNGFEQDGTTKKFDVVTIESDISVSYSGSTSGSTFIQVNLTGDTLYYSLVSESISGTTVVNNKTIYRTDLNEIRYYDNTGTASYLRSLPIAIVTRSPQISSINQIFQDMGYIGSVVWAGKGIKYLRGNGRNSDGSLKNIEHTTTGVQTVDLSTATDGRPRIVFDDSDTLKFTDSVYDPTTNLTIPSIHSYCYIGMAHTISGEIKYCTFKNTLNLLDLLNGEWRGSGTTLAENVTIPTSSNITYDLSSYLPNDDFEYEVMATGTISTDSTSGHVSALRITSSVIRTVPINLCRINTRTSSTMTTGGNAIIPIGPDRKLSVVSGDFYGTFYLHLGGFRRLGRNY